MGEWQDLVRFVNGGLAACVAAAAVVLARQPQANRGWTALVLGAAAMATAEWLASAAAVAPAWLGSIGLAARLAAFLLLIKAVAAGHRHRPDWSPALTGLTCLVALLTLLGAVPQAALPFALVHLLTLAGLAVAVWWRTGVGGSVGRYLGIAAVVAYLAVFSLAAVRHGQSDDRAARLRLVTQAEGIAATIEPEVAARLTFTAADADSPEFQRLSSQMRAYARATGLRSQYTMAMRGGQVIFGPESLTADDPLASPPGTIYEQPTNLLRDSLVTPRSFTEGPYTDEYGTFVSAVSPVVDPTSETVIMLVGIDAEAEEWLAGVQRARLRMLLFGMALLLVILAGGAMIAVRNGLPADRQPALRQVEAITTLAIGLALTVLTASLAHTAESAARRDNFTALASSHITGIRLELSDVKRELARMTSFFLSSEEVSDSEFTTFTAPLLTEHRDAVWAWLDATDSSAATLAHVAPRGELSDRVGQDLRQDPDCAEAIERAVRLRQASATLPGATGRGLVKPGECWVFQPAFVSGRLAGLAAARVSWRTKLQSRFSDTAHHSASIAGLLYQLADEAEPLLLAAALDDRQRSLRESDLAAGLSKATTGHALQLVAPLFSFGQPYALVAQATPEYRRGHPLLAGWLALGSGLLLTAILTALVSTLLRGRAGLEQQVALRTEALQASENHLAATLQSIGDGVIACDRDGRVTSLNRVAEILTGWSLAEAAGRAIQEVFQIVHAQTREVVVNPVEQALREGINVDLANHTVLVSRDGTERQIADSCAPIRDTAGVVIGAVLVFRDVSDEYEQREELRRVKAAVDSTADAIGMATAGGLHFYQNEAFTELFGYTLEEVAQQRPDILFANPAEAAEMFGIIMTGGSWQGEIEMVAKDGRRVAVQLRADSITDDDGQVIGLVGVHTDITERKLAEEALIATEERFSQVTEQSRTIAWEVDANGLYTYLSRAVATVLGYQPEELIGRFHFYDLHPEEGREAFAAQALAAFERREVFTGLENAVVAKDGTAIWVTTNGLPLVDADGRLLGYRGSDTDITERKQAEEALALSREQYMLAVNGSNDGIWDWDLRNNSLFLSATWKKLIGYADHELPNEFASFESQVHPEDWPQIAQRIEAYLSGGVAQYEIEFRLRHKDGHYRWILARGEALRDADGKPYRMAGSHTDITERKEAEEALRASETRVRAITDAAQDAILMMDADGRISFWNPAAERILGYSAAEAMGQNLHEFLAPERYRPAFQAAFGHYQKSGEGAAIGQTLELEALHRDGREIPVELSVSALHLDGAWHAVALLRDITERQQTDAALRQAKDEAEALNRHLERQTALATEMAAQAAQANIAKSEFLANMSHEIRTPMNGVIGMTGLLLDTDLNEEQRHFAQTVQSCAEALLGLINDILDFSKIEAGRMDLEILDFDLRSLLDDFAGMIAVKADERELEFICQADPAVPAMLRGDPGRLRQILTNLVGNAIKFTHEGEVAVRVTAVEESPEQATLRFSVTDTGIGIPAEKIDELFEQFTQADASTTRQYGGTGLGLAISKQLAELMDGEIGVESVVGEGSEFWFTAVFGKQSELRRAVPPPADLRGVRVLVVDDNATNREIVIKQLTAWGARPAEVTGAAGAMEALRAAQAEQDPYELAVLDLLMPETDGAELGGWIKQDPKLAATRLVLMTSMGQRGDAKRLEELGFSAYLLKPVREAELLGCLQTVLSQSPSDSEPTGLITRHTVRELSWSSARILLAEDNATNQQVALGILRKLGLKADAVANGMEVLQALETVPYDLVLMDIQMPEMDGLEATRCIREEAVAVRNPAIPIIAMTAHAMADDRQRCLDAGMNDYVTKPIDVNALTEALARWLPNHITLPGATPPPPPAAAEFDRDGLMSRLMDDEELLGEIIVAFLNDLPPRLDELAETVAAGDTTAAHRLAHAVKGAAANMGGDQLAACAREMEQACLDNDVGRVRELLPELQQRFERFRAILSAEADQAAVDA